MSIDLREKAREIIRAWNSHDLQKFMEFHDEALEYSSPVIRKLCGRDIARLHGKAEIARVWKIALEKYPDITSTIIDILEGTDSVVVYYTSTAKDGTVVDVMRFNKEGQVVALDVFYS